LKLITKSQIEKCQAETAADSEQKDEDLFVSQHSSKPNVACWRLSIGKVI